MLRHQGAMVDLEARDAHGCTPLMFAAAAAPNLTLAAKEDLMQVLLKYQIRKVIHHGETGL